MAILSINLGVINLFPIPILDGGHFIFLALEAILRKPISIKKMELAQQAGLVLIILLMVFAFYNDILRILSPEGLKF
jgi:regulator of sigma E protease